MDTRAINEFINKLPQQVPWLETAADGFQGWVHNTYEKGGQGGQKVQNFLNGTWLGHPLHSVLVDIPIGTWTAALMLDLLEIFSGRKRYGKAADAAILLGAVGATGAAVAGATDWQHTQGEARRTGFLHALLNGSTIVFYLLSLAARRSKNRGMGRSLAIGGYALLFASAYIGGDLVYRQKVGVRHGITAHGQHREYEPVLIETELAEGQMKCVLLAGRMPVLLARQNEQIYALADTCTHMSGSLAQGTLKPDESVVCPLHGSRYDLVNGRVIDGPSTYPQARFDVRVRNGQIEVRESV